MGKTAVENRRKTQKEVVWYERIAKYFLLNMLLSFIGWAYETTLMFFMTGGFQNRGFLSLPLCPIYGSTLMTVYFLLGTPDEGRGILKHADDPLIRGIVYLFVAFLVPTVAELIVGAVFDRFFGVWLWSYNGLPMNFRGYISLPVSILWMVMIFFFMKFLFPPLKRTVFKIPKTAAIVFAVTLAIAVGADVVLSYMAM